MERFAFQLLICSAEMSAVALVYIGLLRLFKNRQQPVVRYYAWLFVLVGFMMPFKPSFGGSAVTITVPENSAPASATGTVTQAAFNYGRLIFIVWILGAAASLVHLLLRYKVFRKSIERLSKPVDKQMQILADDIASSMEIWAQVSVLSVKGLSTPMLTGLFKPTVLLPQKDYSHTQLSLILRHELTHFKHRDLWFKLLFLICRSLHWFNPLMLLIDRSIDEECEHFCDSSVMNGESRQTRKDYCESILSSVGVSNGKSRIKPVLATNFYSPKQSLRHRFSLLLSGKKMKKHLAVCAVAVLLTAVSGSVIAFAQTQQKAEPTPEPAQAQVTGISSGVQTQATYAQTTRKSSEDQHAETTVTYAVTSRAQEEVTTETLVTTAPAGDETVISTYPEPEQTTTATV